MEKELLVLSGHRQGWGPKSKTGCLEGCGSRKKEMPHPILSSKGESGRHQEAPVEVGGKLGKHGVPEEFSGGGTCQVRCC